MAYRAGYSPFLCFELLDECCEMRGMGVARASC
jgi:hypothetical protein